MAESLEQIVVMPILLTMLGCGFLAFVARLVGRDLPKPSMKRSLAITGVLFVCGIGLTMLGMMIPSIQSSNQRATDEANASRPWVEHTIAGGRFSISTPANWELNTDTLVDPGVLYLWDRSNDLHLSASGAPRIDLAVNNLTEFTELASQAVAELFDQSSVSEIILTERGEFRVADTTIQVVSNGTNIVYDLRCLECGDYWVEVRLWTTPSKRAEHQETFARIKDSMRVN